MAEQYRVREIFRREIVVVVEFKVENQFLKPNNALTFYTNKQLVSLMLLFGRPPTF